MRWDHDARGLIADEIYTHGATDTQRDYRYDGRGALTLATSGSELASYSYTASGLPDTISDASGARTVHRSANTLIVGNATYTWDAAGRVVGKGEWAFAYGANGQLTHASRPGRQVEFVYDEANQRLLKRVDGAPVRATVAGAVLTEDHFIELVTVGGVVAGVLDNGRFTALLTDPRGTPFAGPDGTPGLASPYGVRASHLGLAEVIDYTRLGWDPDLDVVRMGVRDYDPKLSQFLTPDPLYLEDLDKCQASPLQCTLYGYAGGKPISFVDPTGLGFWSDLAADALEAVATAGGGVAGFFLSGGNPMGAVLGAGLARGFISAPADLIRGEKPSVERQYTSIVEGATMEMGGQVVGRVLISPAVRLIRRCLGRNVDPVIQHNSPSEQGNSAASPASSQTGVLLSPSQIRFSQTSVNGVEDLVASMNETGWNGPPINVVRMPDGVLTTFDNTRVLAASRANIQVRAVIHEPSDPFPSGRWTTREGVEPATWGDAVNARIQQQSRPFRTRYPAGSFITGSAN